MRMKNLLQACFHIPLYVQSGERMSIIFLELNETWEDKLKRTEQIRMQREAGETLCQVGCILLTH